MNRRLLGILAAVALAVIGTAVLIGYVRGADERAIAGKQLVPALFVSGFGPVEAETPIDRIPTEVRQIPADVRHPNHVANLADAAGLVTSVELLPGEQLLWDRLIEPKEIEDKSPSRVEVPDGFVEVTIPVAAGRALAGTIRPGSLVGIVATFPDANISGIGTDSGITNRLGGSARTVVAPPPSQAEPTEYELRQAEALGAGPADTVAFVAPDPETPEEEAGASTHFLMHDALITELHSDETLPAGSFIPTGDDAPSRAPTGEYLITFAVRAYDVERLVYAAEFGSLWLTRADDDADLSGIRPQTSDTILEQIELPLVLPTPDPASAAGAAAAKATSTATDETTSIQATPTPAIERPTALPDDAPEDPNS